jgi:Fe2+ transport system protein B
MLEALATIILAIVGIMLFLFVMLYGIYVTFYPLGKTVQGGIDAMKELAEEAEEKRLHGKRMPEPAVAKYV